MAGGDGRRRERPASGPFGNQADTCPLNRYPDIYGIRAVESCRARQYKCSIWQPEVFARVFLDEGPSLAALLEEGMKRGIASTYARELLTAFGSDKDRTPTRQDLIEPLSERELEVLRLLATDIDGPDVARELVVSLSTIRSRTKAIYSKLGVHSRRAAVHRGEELGLLPGRNYRPRNSGA